MTELVVQSATLKVGDAVLLDDAGFSLRPRELVAILGPNGAGKTSLIRAALGLETLGDGEAYLGDRVVGSISPIERARLVSYLPQVRPLAWPNRVRDVVALGRFSHGAALGNLKGADADAVDQALLDCDLNHLSDRRADTLSGGELARVHCARAFAAEAPLLVADEPTAALDPRHQFRILDLIKAYVEKGGGALVVLHDVELAARYASRLIWMKAGQVVADGAPKATLSAGRLENVYGVRAKVDGLRVDMKGAL